MITRTSSFPPRCNFLSQNHGFMFARACCTIGAKFPCISLGWTLATSKATMHSAIRPSFRHEANRLTQRIEGCIPLLVSPCGLVFWADFLLYLMALPDLVLMPLPTESRDSRFTAITSSLSFVLETSRPAACSRSQTLSLSLSLSTA